MITVEQLANMIDHTNLKAFADDAALRNYVMRRKNIILRW